MTVDWLIRHAIVTFLILIHSNAYSIVTDVTVSPNDCHTAND